MPDEKATVLVIDDDDALRESLRRLLRSVNLECKLFASIPDFKTSALPAGPVCLVLDVRLPGRTGLDLQKEFASMKVETPIVFITGHGDIPMSVQAMKNGAVEFLTKPFREQDFVEAVHQGLARDRSRLLRERAKANLWERFAALSPRERQVMIEVVRGRLSKQIAADIGISEPTVKVHRSNLMRKMKAGSLPELGRMADKLNLVQEST